MVPLLLLLPPPPPPPPRLRVHVGFALEFELISGFY
jgi:hypothetical protein